MPLAMFCANRSWRAFFKIAIGAPLTLWCDFPLSVPFLGQPWPGAAVVAVSPSVGAGVPETGPCACGGGVPGAALAKSVGRLPTGPVALSDLDQPQTEKLPASPIGAALDLVVFFERERAE